MVQMKPILKTIVLAQLGQSLYIHHAYISTGGGKQMTIFTINQRNFHWSDFDLVCIVRQMSTEHDYSLFFPHKMHIEVRLLRNINASRNHILKVALIIIYIIISMIFDSYSFACLSWK